MKFRPSYARPFVGIKHGKGVNEQPAGVTSEIRMLLCGELKSNPAEQQGEEREPQAACGLAVEHLSAAGQEQGHEGDQPRMMPGN